MPASISSGCAPRKTIRPQGKGVNLKSAWANFNGGRSLGVPPAFRTVTVANEGAKYRRIHCTYHDSADA